MRLDKDKELSEKLSNPDFYQEYSFDLVFTKYIGWGRFQNLCFIVIFLSILGDALEIIVVSLLLPIFRNTMEVTMEEINFMGSAIFFGFTMGPLFVSYLADKIGRKNSLLISTLGQFLFGIISSFANNFFVFTILRVLYCMFMGISLPIVITYISEITPVNIRGKALAMISLPFGIGTIIICLLAKLFLTDDFQNGNWRGLLVTASLPLLLTAFLCKILIKESPRYLMSVNRVDEGLKIMQEIAEENGRKFNISSREKGLFINWINNNLIGEERNFYIKFKCLFNEKYFKISLIIWISWVVQTVNTYGMNFALPMILSLISDKEENFGINDFLILTVIETLACPFAYFLIERKMFGRKNSLKYGYILCTLGYFGVYFSSNNHFMIFGAISKFICQFIWCIVDAYTAEVYNTNLRSTAISAASLIGRIGGIIMPWICAFGFSIGPKGPFIGFGICSLIALSAVFYIPYDTVGTEIY